MITVYNSYINRYGERPRALELLAISDLLPCVEHVLCVCLVAVISLHYT